jgi:hypothetical protein
MRLRPAALVALTAVLALAAGLPAAAGAHGDESLSDQPARALTQQALALLTQKGDSVEALERLEAAEESKDTDNVKLPAVREAADALKNGDTDAAVKHMNEALTAGEQSKQKQPEGGAGGPEGGAGGPDEHAAEQGGESPAAGAEPDAAGAALEDHANAVDPDRGAAEWTGFAVGIVLLGLGAAALLPRRRSAS